MIASHHSPDPNTMMTSSSKNIRINEIPPFFLQLPNLDVHCLSGLASSPRSEQQSQLPHLLLRRGKVIIFLYSAAAPIKLFLRFRVQFRRALSSCCTDSQTLDNRYFSKLLHDAHIWKKSNWVRTVTGFLGLILQK